MSLIIDGYNLLHASGIIGRGIGPGGLERSRTALLNFLAESLALEELPRTIVVFDAKQSPHGFPRKLEYRGLFVHFAAKYDDADSLIEELVQQDTAPKRLTVVSSDHRIHRAAHRRGATAVDSDVWFAEIVRLRRELAQRAPESTVKPGASVSESEVEFWLREFSSDRPRDPGKPVDSPAETPIDNPFPPGYADDLLDDEE